MDKDQMIKDVVDRLDKLGHLPDLFLKTGLALAGYQSTGHWTGALTALVGLKLAESRNLAAGAAGVATLSLIGLNTAFKDKDSLFKNGQLDPYWFIPPSQRDPPW